MASNGGDFACGFDGCRRCFKRQEHLTRHQRSHDPANIFVCEVCQREFNRKDSLHRHLALHGDVLTPSLPKKTKRACIACRRGKNKCDGEAKCSTCVRREVECRYHDGEDDVMGGTTDDLSPQNGQEPYSIRDTRDSRTVQSVASRNTPNPTTGLQHAVVDEQLMHQPPTIPKALGQGKIINWMNVLVRQDPINLASIGEAETEEDRLNHEAYTREYFRSFHHRWTLIHRPTYHEGSSSDTLVVASVRMIGAWLVGSVESRNLAWATHEKFVVDILPTLHRVNCHDNLWEALPASLCHSVVLNIIFGIYTGKQTDISRCSILLKTLVAALREIGFFDEDTAWPDEKPKLFPPMRMCALGQRQRLATYLFKIDAYLAILRNQPPSLTPEDLYFTLPTTYAIYNSDGLHIWEERANSEPNYRNQTTLFKMITENFSDFQRIENNVMLIEDIQTCLCAAWSAIWRLSKNQKLLREIVPAMTTEKVALRHHLNALKARLDRIHIQLSPSTYVQQDLHLSNIYYQGHEDPSLPSTASVADARMQDLLTDSVMLYHLLSINLSTNVAVLIRIAKDSNLTPVEEVSEAHEHARSKRLCLVKQWTTSPNARRSLCHSVDILVASRSSSENTDPVSNIALIFAAIVVHAYCTYGSCACIICLPNPLVAVVELTAWSNPGTETLKNERETWIEMGDAYRPQVQGIQLCRCNTHFLVEFYRTCLPVGWECGDIIPHTKACH